MTDQTDSSFVTRYLRTQLSVFKSRIFELFEIVMGYNIIIYVCFSEWLHIYCDLVSAKNFPIWVELLRYPTVRKKCL